MSERLWSRREQLVGFTRRTGARLQAVGGMRGGAVRLLVLQGAHRRGVSRSVRPSNHADLSAFRKSARWQMNRRRWWRWVGVVSAGWIQAFSRQMLDVKPHQRFVLSMHWYFAPNGASVSPHTDARRKIGSHIFYFNTEDDWEPSWGGQTLVLDDEGRLSAHASPAVETLRQVAASEILGNKSFIFKRTEHSWHAVKPIVCPVDRLRKVFIVVVNRVNLQVLWRRVRGKDPDEYPM